MQESDFYRPPRDDAPPPAPSPSGGDGLPVPWEPTAVISAAWEVLKAHWLVLIFATQAVAWLPAVPSWVLNQAKLDGAAGVGVWFAGALVQLLLSAFLGAGLCRMLVAGARRELMDFAALVEGGPAFGRMLGAEVLVGLVRWTLILTTMAPAAALVVSDMGIDAFTSQDLFLHRFDRITVAPVLAFMAGSLVLLVLSVFVTLRLHFAPYYVVDAGRGAIESLGSSWKATDGQLGQLVVFGVLSGLLDLAGLCLCCVGFLPMMALTQLAQAIIYTRISGRVGEAAGAGLDGGTPNLPAR